MDNKLVWVKDYDDAEWYRLDLLLSSDGSKWCVDDLDLERPITLQDIVNYCEDRAEGANYHSFYDVYGKLAKVLVEETDEETATNIMHRIAVDLSCLIN